MDRPVSGRLARLALAIACSMGSTFGQGEVAPPVLEHRFEDTTKLHGVLRVESHERLNDGTVRERVEVRIDWTAQRHLDDAGTPREVRRIRGLRVEFPNRFGWLRVFDSRHPRDHPLPDPELAEKLTAFMASEISLTRDRRGAVHAIEGVRDLFDGGDRTADLAMANWFRVGAVVLPPAGTHWGERYTRRMVVHVPAEPKSIGLDLIATGHAIRRGKRWLYFEEALQQPEGRKQTRSGQAFRAGRRWGRFDLSRGFATLCRTDLHFESAAGRYTIVFECKTSLHDPFKPHSNLRAPKSKRLRRPRPEGSVPEDGPWQSLRKAFGSLLRAFRR